ncbi:MAG: efflux RND transporter permease subunit, partial [Candidatus Obscuribacterales bacterium]
MIEKLIQFAMTNRLLTAAAVVGIACLGLYCMLSLSVDSFPDVSNVQVQIITEPESMATEEIERDRKSV